MKSFFSTYLNVRKLELYYILITVYIIFCIVFAYERMLNTDSSFQLFNIINSKNFFFQENRFGVWLSQIPLLISIVFHIPMKALIFIYSISFPLEYLLIIWINIKYFKCKEAALASIISLIIGVAFTFFHSITETHQLLALSSLLFGMLYAKKKFKNLKLFYTLVFILLIWCLFTHPIAIFTSSVVIGFAVLQNNISRKDVMFTILFCILFTLFKFMLTQKGTYDSRQYDNLFQFKETIPNFFSLYSYRYLMSKIPTTYFSAFCIIFIVWLKYKNFPVLIFGSICFALFTFLSILTFSAGDCDAMMEKAFLPGIFVFVLIYSIFFYQTENKKAYYIATILLCTLSFINIKNAGDPYNNRIKLLSSILNNMDSQTPKIIANYSDFDQNIIRFNHWGTSMDVLLLSKSKSGIAKTIFLSEDKTQCLNETTDPNNFLYLSWNPHGMKIKNKEYFDFDPIPYKIYEKK